MHLTIDGYGGDREALSSEALVSSLLDRYPGAINMIKITEPFVYRYEGVKPEDWGVTGFVIIAESHIAIHTFPEHGYVWVDVFSCKGFEDDLATDLIVDAFKLEKIKTNILERGLEYPHSIREATPVAMGERFAVAGSRGTPTA